MKRFIPLIFGLLLSFNSVQAADSAGNRQDDLFLVGIQPVGLHVPTILAPPLQLGLALGDFQLGVDLGSATYEDTVEDSDASVTYTNQGAWARYFVGNSFFLKAGYHQRTWDAQGSYSETYYSTYSTSTLTAKADIQATANVASAGIGNIWSFDSGFYIGAEWVVMESIVSESSSYSITSNTGVDTDTAEQEFEDMIDTANQASGIGGFAVLTLGWAF